jgi:hypothetical protein
LKDGIYRQNAHCRQPLKLDRARSAGRAQAAEEHRLLAHLAFSPDIAPDQPRHLRLTISWRARVYDRESLRVQWQCDNRSGERRYCSISDKTYACFAGNVPAGQGGGIGEASDVAAGRQYAFVGETGCRGDGLTFLLPQARVGATPAL